MSQKQSGNEEIITYPVEELLSAAFSRYASYVLLDRAIPDVRDGLKPVQRRILYAMADLGLTHDKSYKKAARIVGEVIGKYHPHGDSSVYAALVRMSQTWKTRLPLVTMQGNNGSIDGDSAAAMRYTEVKLSAISQWLLTDLKPEVVAFVPNFDESEVEPEVLPAYFPNLLVNGATGIAVGLATNIPPHNLHEVIDALILRLNEPNCSVAQLMKIIKGPDFPTGGIIQGVSGIKKAYETGRGKIMVVAKTKIEVLTKPGKNSTQKRIVITEIPYEVLKQDIVKKIEEIRCQQNPTSGIKEVRDETDRQGLRIVVDLTHDAEPQQLLNYLLKHTNLQIAYHFNLVAIANNRPKVMNLPTILDHYLAHQVTNITNRSKYELQQKEKRLAILEGLILALKDVDQLVTIIKNSPNRATAVSNLEQFLKLTTVQAEAIVQLRLYRLTASDVTALLLEKKVVKKAILHLKAILSDRSVLNQEISNRFMEIKQQFAVTRHSSISGEIKEIVINERALIKKTTLFITVSSDGWIKAINTKLINETLDYEAFGRKPNDVIVAQGNFSNLDNLLVVTNKGNYLIIPGHKLQESKWKDIGYHLNNWCRIDSSEKVIAAIVISEGENYENAFLVIATTFAIKRLALQNLLTARTCRSIRCMQLVADDEVVAASVTDGTKWLILTSKSGLTVKYSETNVPVLGLNARGVKALKLDDNDIIVGAISANDHDIYGLVSDQGSYKRILVANLALRQRTQKGQKVLKIPKNKKMVVVTTFLANDDDKLNYLTNNETWSWLLSQEIPVTGIEVGYGKTIAANIVKASSFKLWTIANKSEHES